MEDLVVAPGTLEQWKRGHELQRPMWGKGLTAEQFAEREQILNVDDPFAARAMSRWVLVPRNDTKTLDYASSCESYRREIVINDGRGNVHEAHIESIASVFTEEKKRGRGYAQRMMTLLHDQFVERDALASVLYSDIGNFYARAKREHVDSGLAKGWEIVSPRHIVWQVDASQQNDGTSTSASILRDEDFDRVCEADATRIRAEVGASPSSCFAILPTGDQWTWFTTRCRCMDKFQRQKDQDLDRPPLGKWGVEVGGPSSSSSLWAFAFWTMDLVKAEMEIGRIRASTPDQLRMLLSEAHKVAAEYGMKTINAWNVDERLLQGTGWTNVTREDHLPALAWYGPENKPDAWYANEHWCWC